MNLRVKFAQAYFESQRENHAKAVALFDECSAHVDAVRIKTHILHANEFPVEDVINSYLQAVDKGDVKSIPYAHLLIQKKDIEHPRESEISHKFNTELESKDPEFLLHFSLALEAISPNQSSESLQLLLDAAELNSSLAINLFLQKFIHSEPGDGFRLNLRNLMAGYKLCEGIDLDFDFRALRMNPQDLYPGFEVSEGWKFIQNLLAQTEAAGEPEVWITHLTLFRVVGDIANVDSFLNFLSRNDSPHASLFDNPEELLYITLFFLEFVYANPQSEIHKYVSRLNELGLEEFLRVEIETALQAMQSSAIFDEDYTYIESDDDSEEIFSSIGTWVPPTPKELSKEELKSLEIWEEIREELEALLEGDGSTKKLVKLFKKGLAINEVFCEYLAEEDNFRLFINGAEDFEDDPGEHRLRDEEAFRFFLPLVMEYDGDSEIMMAVSDLAPRDVLEQLVRSDYEWEDGGTQYSMGLVRKERWILERLSQSDNLDVKWAVSSNPNTPLDILEKLSSDYRAHYFYIRGERDVDTIIAFKAATNPNASRELTLKVKKFFTENSSLIAKEHHGNMQIIDDVIQEIDKHLSGKK